VKALKDGPTVARPNVNTTAEISSHSQEGKSANPKIPARVNKVPIPTACKRLIESENHLTRVLSRAADTIFTVEKMPTWVTVPPIDKIYNSIKDWFMRPPIFARIIDPNKTFNLNGSCDHRLCFASGI
jgi:hypothetical protein